MQTVTNCYGVGEDILLRAQSRGTRCWNDEFAKAAIILLIDSLGLYTEIWIYNWSKDGVEWCWNRGIACFYCDGCCF